MIATIESRIEELRKDCIEDGEAISENSVASFLSFINALGITVKPLIGLDPENKIYVTWESGKRYVARFDSDGAIRFFAMGGEGKNET